MWRILESTVATLTGGLILWWVTIPASPPARLSQPVPLSQSISPSGSNSPSAERPEDKVAPPIQAGATPSSPLPSTSPRREDPAPPIGLSFVAPAPTTGSAIAISPPLRNVLPYSIPVGSLLLYENFSQFREGEATDWGQNTSVRTGLDRRKWLVSSIEGVHPVGRNIRLPNEFYFECRYSAYMSEATRGIFGWWREPLSTKISFLNDQGAKYTIQWVIGCGNDTTRLNPLGSSSLYPKTYYHSIKLPGGTAKEIGTTQPTGTLRISLDNGLMKVFVDGQVAAAGTNSPMGQLARFEIDVVKAKSGTLFFTDFKIAR